MVKLSLLVVAAVVVGCVCIATPGIGQQKSSPAPALTPVPAASAQPAVSNKNPVKPTAESQAKAKAIYQIDCAMCHGDNGNGKTDLAKGMGLTLDDWTNPATLADKDDSILFNTIRNGKDKMPSEGEGRAKDAEVWNLILFIRSLSKGGAAAATTAAQ